MLPPLINQFLQTFSFFPNYSKYLFCIFFITNLSEKCSKGHSFSPNIKKTGRSFCHLFPSCLFLWGHLCPVIPSVCLTRVTSYPVDIYLSFYIVLCWIIVQHPRSLPVLCSLFLFDYQLVICFSLALLPRDVLFYLSSLMNEISSRLEKKGSIIDICCNCFLPGCQLSSVNCLF